mmetsp:Transcript_135786/g.433254  ORF Transcript_135786/g.433254 Transcript_135786/m.433254 type:complete len:223 (-) Transcript_135786:132-800(-)
MGFSRLCSATFAAKGLRVLMGVLLVPIAGRRLHIHVLHPGAMEAMLRSLQLHRLRELRNVLHGGLPGRKGMLDNLRGRKLGLCHNGVCRGLRLGLLGREGMTCSLNNCCTDVMLLINCLGLQNGLCRGLRLRLHSMLHSLRGRRGGCKFFSPPRTQPSPRASRHAPQPSGPARQLQVFSPPRPWPSGWASSWPSPRASRQWPSLRASQHDRLPSGPAQWPYA